MLVHPGCSCVLFSHGKIWDDAYGGPVVDPSSQWLPSSVKYRHDWHLGTLHSLKLTANAPENGPGPKRKLAVQPSIFRCEPLVSGRVNNHFLMDVWWNNHFPSFKIIQLKQPFESGCFGYQDDCISSNMSILHSNSQCIVHWLIHLPTELVVPQL